MSGRTSPKGQEQDEISIWGHLAAIARNLLPGLVRAGRAIWHSLIFTRFGRYILVPLLVLALGRILVNLSPVVLPGCESSHHSASDVAAVSAACESSKEDVHDLTLDTLLFVLGILASTGLERYGLRDLFANTRKIAHEAQRHPFLAKLGATRFEQTYALLTGLAHKSFVVLSSEAMHEWFAVFFTESPGRYRGVDTHLPSEYLERYSWYLSEHEDSLKDRAERGLLSNVRDVRVLAVDQKALGDNFIDHEKQYREFVKWHTRNNVDVYWMPRREVRKLCKKFHIGTSDVGLWDDYGVLFDNLADGSVELSLRFKGARKRDKLSYKEVSQFMDQIVNAATRLTEVPPDLDIFGGDMADRWEEYVNPEAREAVLGPFLDETLRDHPVVLDAAAGIGCESIYLLKKPKQPFSVYSNEVDGRFAAVAEARAAQAHVVLNVKKHRWESLPGALEGNMRFNAVLVLGNSLCMVPDGDRRRRCLQAFFESLRSGGILVIDERNFQPMLDKRDRVVADPFECLPFVKHGDVMYHGAELRGFPTKITDETVTWAFFDNDPPVQSGSDIPARHIPEADCELYPFKHGELYTLLRAAGFVNIDVYADLTLVAEGRGDKQDATMPSAEAVADAAFLTYVARRPT